ncbi:MAG TPA: tetratricopeptide repeat protein [Candidatus Acidoferrum sp.]|nr:tetratricopeptide repeat protein [Candidatus Acidoferrum sp.]
MEILNFRTRPVAAIALGLWAGGSALLAEQTPSRIFAARAEAAWQSAQARFQSHTNDSAAAWQFARACYDLNDFVTNNAGRADLAIQGIVACRHLLAMESNSAPGHYYLAIELGQLADTKRNPAAIKMVREIEREFKAADDLDEHLDYAGPARCLGLLYRDAPGWPLSIGSRHKARDWLESAAALAPGYPENHLNLAETYWQWKDHEAARNELNALDALWPAARTNFAGETWERCWDDWSTRRNALREKMGETWPAAHSSKSSRN